MAFLGILIARSKWAAGAFGLATLAIGTYVYVSAHPAQPSEVNGYVLFYSEERGAGGVYHGNQLQLEGDPTVYTLDKTAFHPALPDTLLIGGHVQIWVDLGTYSIIAMSIFDQQNQNSVKYTTPAYDNPQSAVGTGRFDGIFLGTVGSIFLIIFVIWHVRDARSDRRSANRIAARWASRTDPLK